MIRPLHRRTLLSLPVAAGAVALAACSDGEETTVNGPSAVVVPYATGAVRDASFVPPGLRATQGTEYRFGDHLRQASDLWLPDGERREALVVVVHGGGWDATTDRRDLLAVVADLVRRGWPVLSTDYRGNGGGGGWPTTFTDVAAAVDSAAEVVRRHSLPQDRIVAVGHSAGGHLAAWAAARHTLPAGAPGAGPRVPLSAVASMSGVLHPTSLGHDGGDGHVRQLFGGTPEEVDARYALGDPTRRVPLGKPSFVVHGTADGTVPVSQAQEFTDAATAAGDTVELQLLPGVPHTDPLDPAGRSVPLFRSWLESVV